MWFHLLAKKLCVPLCPCSYCQKMKRSIVFGLLAVAQRAVFALPMFVSSTDIHDTYDYVIVGGGTGGMALANRLSEDGSSMSSFTLFKVHQTDRMLGTVLLIEAGPL